MPHYLSIGVSWDKFMDSCPNELKPYDIAYKIKLKEKDSMMYAWVGKYMSSAVFTAVEHCLYGRKAKSKYADNTIMDEIEKGKMQEKDLQKQRELFVAKLQAMQANFELNHNDKSSGKK